ncbi:hypothetical protein G6F43_000015 [Rhizopus delemar]|nr:hypothetical protein G6F43_000015 [Rhizopus delemar]
MNKLNNSNRGKVEQIIEGMSRKFSLDKSGDSYTGHPKVILDELENKGSEEQFVHIMKGVGQLAVYSYATSRTTKTEVRSIVIKALRLPGSIKHLEEEPSSDKPSALDKRDVNKIFLVSYEQSMLRAAVGRRQNPFNQRGKTFGKQQWNTRGRGSFQKSFLEGAGDPHKRNPKLQINLNKTNKVTSVFPQGGRLQQFSIQWRQQVLHQWPVSVITQGYQLQWNRTPRPLRYTPMEFTQEEQMAVDEAVQKFFSSGSVERSPSQNKNYLSNFFAVQKQPNVDQY